MTSDVDKYFITLFIIAYVIDCYLISKLDKKCYKISCHFIIIELY
jgi:hypothetical protein